MSSSAYGDHLVSLLEDAAELGAAHSRLRTGNRGRQWRLGALNRAVVVMSLSAWEAYVEELIREAIESFRPAQPANTPWQSVKTGALSQIGRFNNPNADNVRQIIADTIGLQDVTRSWSWQNTTPTEARDRLGKAIRLRHHIAHGVNPRPIVHNQYASGLPGFFRALGAATDRAVRDHLIQTLHVTSPWTA
jgi:hypothetical protein